MTSSRALPPGMPWALIGAACLGSFATTSSGTTTSQIAAKEPIPPVFTATAVTSPVNASEESTCALSYWPVRDRK